MTGRAQQNRRGFTLLEMAVALVLFALVIGNVYTILGGTTKSMAARGATFEVDLQAERALTRIALAVIGSTSATIFATSESPGFQPSINYDEFIGMADVNGASVEVFSPPMRIAMTDDSGGEVSWFENPGEPAEKRVVWVKNIPQVALGEIADNGIDDNGNGLIDETGLAFVKEGRTVRIVLSMRRPDGNGGFLECERETTVTCRN